MTPITDLYKMIPIPVEDTCGNAILAGTKPETPYTETNWEDKRK